MSIKLMCQLTAYVPSRQVGIAKKVKRNLFRVISLSGPMEAQANTRQMRQGSWVTGYRKPSTILSCQAEQVPQGSICRLVKLPFLLHAKSKPQMERKRKERHAKNY